MKRIMKGLGLSILALVVLVAGCAKYKITDDLSEQLDDSTPCKIGVIDDALPAESDPEDKPSVEDVEKLQNFLAEELLNKGLFVLAGTDAVDPRYEVRGSILEFKKGSGAARFFIGFGVGNAKLTVRLELVDAASGKILFGGNFKQSVSSWMESGEETFKRVAKDFAKALEKQAKVLRKV